MSMFDYVYFKCPKCKAIAESQSKASKCGLNLYFINDIAYELPVRYDDYDDIMEYEPAPIEIYNEAVKHGLVCDICKHKTGMAPSVNGFVFTKVKE